MATVGIADHIINRNKSGAQANFYNGTDYTDQTVLPATGYQYNIVESTFHRVWSAQTFFNVTTPPAYDIDPRRTGLKPLGTYWGGGGEQIDMLSGNLNYTLPMVTAQGRGGWSVPFSLSYNSQQWRKDSDGSWNLGQDVGYGFGWRLMAGSLTPYWHTGAWLLDHFLYIDSTGAEYRLYPQTTGSNIWISQLQPSTASGGTPQSGESIYVYYDSNTQILHFRNGSFWVMGCMSGGTEQDNGTMYPTVMEDRNGNQVIVRYMTGAVANYPNSSARISEIEDTRAVANGSSRRTYWFGYALPDATGIPHLLSVNNGIGTAENYTFSVTPATIQDPFAGTKKVTTDLLASAANGIPLTTQFFYDASGELNLAYLPYGGYMRWMYSPVTYTRTFNSATQMAVTSRFLAMSSDASTKLTNHQPVTEATYLIGYNAPSSSQPVVPRTCLTDAADATGIKAYRCWYFNSNANSTWALNGLPSNIFRQASQSATTNLTHDTLTWTLEPTQANPYIAYRATNTDEGTPSVVYSLTSQAVDTYGNVTQSKQWDYSTAPISLSSAAARTYNNVYRTNCTGGSGPDCVYTSGYILNLLASSAVTDASGVGTTLVANSYDANALTPITGAMYEYDTAYGTGLTTRGNLTSSVTPSSTTNTFYDQTGTPTTANDGNAHGIAVSMSPTTNYSAPSAIQPSTGSQMDSSLSASMTYTSFLGINQQNAPNGSQASATYDPFGRPLTTTAATGAVTSYFYNFGPWTAAGQNIQSGAYSTMTEVNIRERVTVNDGLGRVLTTVDQYGGWGGPVVVSTVDTVYGPGDCSPTGQTIKVSQPYAPGDTETWTTYSYDGLGRTLTTTRLADGSKTVSVYQGNWTTVTDPAGKWKQYKHDAFGNTLVVVEPDPAAPPAAPNPPSLTAANTLITNYSYDVFNHLVGVSMQRKVNGSTVTQTRAFNYNTSLRLASKSEPETGTTTYTYNPDGTLATRMDANSQTTYYNYDAYQRLTKKTYGSGPSAPYESYYYDGTGPEGNNSSYYSGSMGRLSSVAYGGASSACSKYPQQYLEDYAYNPAGEVTSKVLKRMGNPSRGCTFITLQATFDYDPEGKVDLTQMTFYGGAAVPYSGALVLSPTYDSMDRLSGISDGWVTWANGAVYNAANRLTSLYRLGSYSRSGGQVGETETWQYNQANQLTQISVNNAPIWNYSYNAGTDNGQIASSTDTQLGYTATYQYDALKRLTQQTATSANPATLPNWTQTFQYGGFGNLTSKSTPAGSAEQALPTIDPGTNRISGSGSVYDFNGNLTTTPSGHYLSYDYENRMIWENYQNSYSSYTYDPYGRRIADSTNGNALALYGPDGRLLFEYDGGNSFGCRIYFGGMLLGVESVNIAGSTPVATPTSTLTDRLGSGTKTYPYGTDIGNPVYSDLLPSFATYTRNSAQGLLADDLLYANQRWYSPGLGRFTSADKSARVQEPGGWNRYAYVAGDPMNRVDPTGEIYTLVCGFFDDSSSSSDCSGAFINTNIGVFVTGLPVDPTFTVDVLLATALGTAASGGGGGGAAATPARQAPVPTSLEFLRVYQSQQRCQAGEIGAYFTIAFQVFDQYGQKYVGHAGAPVLERWSKWLYKPGLFGPWLNGDPKVDQFGHGAAGHLSSDGTFTDDPWGVCQTGKTVLQEDIDQIYSVRYLDGHAPFLHIPDVGTINFRTFISPTYDRISVYDLAGALLGGFTVNNLGGSGPGRHYY